MATHVEFLWQQLQTANSEGKSLNSHLEQPVWQEILHTDLKAIPLAHGSTEARDRRVVTAYVGSLFEWIFHEIIQVIEPSSDDGMISDNDIFFEELLPIPKVPQHPRYYSFHHKEYRIALHPRFTTSTRGSIKVGDVVELRRDEQTRWKKSTQKWYAFVTDRWSTATGIWKFRILWLYWPEDVALCQSMKYPYSNEAFSSFELFDSSYFLAITVNVENHTFWKMLYEKWRWNSSAWMASSKIRVLLQNFLC